MDGRTAYQFSAATGGCRRRGWTESGKRRLAWVRASPIAPVIGGARGHDPQVDVRAAVQMGSSERHYLGLSDDSVRVAAECVIADSTGHREVRRHDTEHCIHGSERLVMGEM